MKIKIQLILLFCVMTVTTFAQNARAHLFDLGDPAPPLRVKEWIKGIPVQDFEEGRVYVVEFWATWCAPCRAAMPHLSALAAKYKHKVTFLAIDINENAHADEMKPASIEKIKAFVDSMGHRMDFPVALGDNNLTVHDWFEVFGEDNSIPKAFVVNAQGKLAWIGHPMNLNKVLPQILNNTWDIKKASSQRIFNKYLDSLDSGAGEKLYRFSGDYFTLDDMGKPDSALLVINEMVRKEPKLKYSPLIAAFTFTALLETNPNKAYEYGKEVIITPNYEGAPAYHSIIGGIKDYEHKLNIPAEIYQLGAEAYRAEIEQCPYPELFVDPYVYNTMANWYWLAGDKSKAVKARRKAKKLTKIIYTENSRVAVAK